MHENSQLNLFTPEALPEDPLMQGISLEEARRRAYKELQTVSAEKRIPFGIVFRGIDAHFGLTVLVVKFRGDVQKFMGCEDSVELRWQSYQ